MKKRKRGALLRGSNAEHWNQGTGAERKYIVQLGRMTGETSHSAGACGELEIGS